MAGEPLQRGTENAHGADQDGDVRRADQPGVAIAEPLQRRCHGAESGNRMTRSRIGQHQIG